MILRSCFSHNFSSRPTVLITMYGNWFIVWLYFGSVDLKGGREECSNSVAKRLTAKFDNYKKIKGSKHVFWLPPRWTKFQGRKYEYYFKNLSRFLKKFFFMKKWDLLTSLILSVDLMKILGLDHKELKIGMLVANS